MAAKRDYYEVLGVSRTASDREIRDAYRKLAIKYHPDHSSDEAATEKFKEAAEAFEVLSDGEKRARYDQFGHAGVEAGGAQFHDMEDIFEAFGDLFGGGVFSDIFGGGRRRGRRPRRGADVRCNVTLDLEEAARGVNKTVEFSRKAVCEPCGGSGSKPGSSPQPCQRCGGRGQVVQSAGILRVQTACPACNGAGAVITDPCENCRGAGYINTRRRLDVHIPAGVDNGTAVRVPGEGEPSPNGGPPGNCYCVVRVREHPLFLRDGRRLLLNLPITYSQAALGATVEVPTLAGRDELKIASGTQSGDEFVLRGRGMPDVHGGLPGDLIVRTHIEVPKRLSKRQTELLRELAEIEHVDVTPKRKSFLKQLREYFSTGEEEEKAS